MCHLLLRSKSLSFDMADKLHVSWWITYRRGLNSWVIVSFNMKETNTLSLGFVFNNTVELSGFLIWDKHYFIVFCDQSLLYVCLHTEIVMHGDWTTTYKASTLLRLHLSFLPTTASCKCCIYAHLSATRSASVLPYIAFYEKQIL